MVDEAPVDLSPEIDLKTFRYHSEEYHQCAANVPVLWEPAKTEGPTPSWFTQAQTSIYHLLLIQAFRPDRLLASAHRLVSAALGETFMDEARGHLDLLSIVEQEIRSNMPILLCAVQPPVDHAPSVSTLHWQLRSSVPILGVFGSMTSA
ncbi:hypothetical protein T265_03607 [Opisthorchis viverrini]|uniref:Uncharacterized protein n=1 Tax=Opisthorchis viverrini TaxID=6198 RepID=A0A074ZQW8_OPIVI|nr:hypothetical protein T265_03607 [Opisthorchis viverrini]KER29808.1 hypothetical protein T265_03607 [Opisthorchis viverrini]